MRVPLAQRIYEWLPGWGKDVACSIEGRRLVGLRRGGRFAAYVDQYRRNESASPEERRQLQLAALRGVLRHCVATVPYYQDVFRRAGFSPADVVDGSELCGLPVLTKGEVLEQGERLQTTAAVGRRVILQTSGTTGTPLRIPVTRDSLQAYQGAVARHRSWFGVGEGMAHATFNGRSLWPVGRSRVPYWVHNHADRQTLFSLYHMRDETLPAYVAELARRPRDYVDGYPSSISVLARYMNERGLRLPWKPRAVFLSSETLGHDQREEIGQALQAPVAEFYGMAEQAACASQCPAGRFHFDPEVGYVEFVPSPHTPGLGRIVCTGLTNLAMPLVRYDTQDLVALEPAGCSCGRGGVVVERIDGRIESFVVTPEGVRVGRLDHVYKGLRGIRESQIVQRRPDQVIVRVVRGPAFRPEVEADLRRALGCRLGPGMSIAVEYVAQIPRSRSGKLRAVISELPGDATDVGASGNVLERAA